MIKVNPYRPGAGLKPMYIAGRDDDIKEARQIFEAMTIGVPVRSMIYSGLRGVGKTVLINRLEEIADDYGIFHNHIEIQDRELYLSNNLTQSLTKVFVTIGETAQKVQTPVCFFIDEIQYMKQEQLGSLIAALHRTNQLGYPVMVIGAGLPRIYKMLSDEKSYSERLFAYKQIGSLTLEQSRKAIEEPAKKFNIDYSDEAIEKIVEITKGYPYFIQQLCQIVYQNTDKDLIEDSDIEHNTNSFFNTLDSGFFKARYERCSESDKKFVFAMVECGELPCTISNVAHNLNKDVGSISTIRAQLINKGIIYPVRYKELDFTVPEFAGFIQRLDEYKQWKIQR